MSNNEQEREIAYSTSLAEIVEWLDQVYATYCSATTAEAPLADMQRLRAVLLSTAPSEDALRDVRLLIAVGIVEWLTKRQQPLPEVSPIVFYSLLTAALWNLVRTRKLPRGW